MPAGTAEFIAVVAGTLVSEDLAAITAGLLAADGRVSILFAISAAGTGIWLGDLGLFLIGSAIGPTLESPWLKRRTSGLDLDAIRLRYARHAGIALVASRFLPGTRLAMYVAAGALGVSAWRFMAWTFVAVLLWVPLIVGGAAWLGEAFVSPLRAYLGSAWVVLPIAAVAVWRAGHLVRAVRAWTGRISRWEYWPPWAFYAPVLPWVGWLMLRHGVRSLSAANPGFEDGGFVGESKARILQGLPAEWVIPYRVIPPGRAAARHAAFEAALQMTGSTFPIILKPDVGQRGAGVRLVKSVEDAVAYLALVPGAVMVQAYHPGPFEAGVFYYRFPDEPRGRIFSITDKQFPVVVGDGVATLAELIDRHPRYRLQRTVFIERHRDRLSTVPPAGESVRLAVAGNHAQGTMFLDGGHLETPELLSRLDAIAQATPGFFIGRFDVRYSDRGRFQAGLDLAVVELNGATSEATHIYDPSRSLLQAYRTLFRQWDLVFRIGAANRRAGCRTSSIGRLARLSWAHITSRAPVLRSD